MWSALLGGVLAKTPLSWSHVIPKLDSSNQSGFGDFCHESIRLFTPKGGPAICDSNEAFGTLMIALRAAGAHVTKTMPSSSAVKGDACLSSGQDFWINGIMFMSIGVFLI